MSPRRARRVNPRRASTPRAAVCLRRVEPLVEGELDVASGSAWSRRHGSVGLAAGPVCHRAPGLEHGDPRRSLRISSSRLSCRHRRRPEALRSLITRNSCRTSSWRAPPILSSRSPGRRRTAARPATICLRRPRVAYLSPGGGSRRCPRRVSGLVLPYGAGWQSVEAAHRDIVAQEDVLRHRGAFDHVEAPGRSWLCPR